MAEDIYYRGEGDENTFHDTTTRQLRDLEAAASEDFAEQEQRDASGALASQRTAENRPARANAGGDGDTAESGGFWRGQGRTSGDSTQGRGRGRRGILDGKAAKFGPAALILVALFGVGGVTFLGTSMGPFALVGNALDQFNVMRTAMNRRSTYFTRFQMDETLNTSLTNKRFGIFSSEKFKISNRMQNRLKQQNIEYMEEPSTRTRYLVYTNPDTGEVTPIVANSKDLSSLDGVEIHNGEGKIATKNVMLLDDVLEADSSFFTAHQSATKTLKGHIVGWFESLTESFHSRIKNTRNKFKGTTDETSDDDVINKAKSEGLSEDMDDAKGKTGQLDESEEYELDEDGKIKYEDDGVTPKKKTVTTEIPYTDSDSAGNGADVAKVESAVKTKAEKAAAAAGARINVLQSVTGLGCAAVSVLNSLNLAITAVQVAKTLNFVTGALEAIQRTQIGDGGSEMMTYFNAFSKPKENEVWTGSGGQASVSEAEIKSGSWRNSSTTTIEKNVISDKSTMASAAYNKVFGGPDVDPDDPGVAKFNRDYAAKYALGESGFGSFLSSAFSGKSASVIYQGCLYAGMVLSAASAVASIALTIATGGLSELFVGFAKAALIAAVITMVGIIISTLIPKVAQLLAKDLISDLGGEDSANALLSGFNIYMGKSMESNSGGVGDEAAVLAMYEQTQEVIADDARYDRATRSPLDPTSKYTFVGSIAHSMIPIGNALTGNSFLTAIGQLMSNVGSSALSIIPGASAASRETWYNLSLNHDCPNLSGLGLVGDAYCNPYYTTDFSTIAMDPYNVVEQIENNSPSGKSQFKEGEVDNPEIDEDSDLAKYIVACTLRDSQYGIKDAAVQSWIEAPTKNGMADALINGAVGLIPIAGDVVNVIQNAMEQKNLVWNTGQACIQNEDINPDWSKNKYYQRYIEDQTLMEAAGIIEESQVTAFINKYYEENPIDNSLEGVIARYSGMTKEEASNTIALAEYITFLGEYNPVNLYPLPVVEKTVEISIGEPGVIQSELLDITPVKYAFYINLRSRTFTV